MNETVTGLGTFTHIVRNTGVRTVSGTMSLPNLKEGAALNSQVVVTIALDGSTIFTSIAGAEGYKAQTYATSGQVLSVTLSSSLPQDAVLNTIKTTISFS